VSSSARQSQGELVLIGNSRFYGGSFPFFPRASLQDGVLDVLVYPKVNWAILLEVGYGWLTSQLHVAGGAIYFQTNQVTLSSQEQVLFELDGENVAPLPVTLSVRHKALRMLVAHT
jgi:diacylglycerol kinase family enzyme